MTCTAAYVTAAATVLVCLIGWYLNRHKLYAEIAAQKKQVEKLEADITMAEGVMLLNSQKARAEFAQACAELSKNIDTLMMLFESGAERSDIDRARETFCSTLQDHVLLKQAA